MPRLPEITSRDQLPEDERHVWDYVEKSRGRVGLPYSVFLHHPELALRKLEVGHFVRFDTSLARNVSELAICAAAREMDCRFEWAMHATAAERVGISEAAMRAIETRGDLAGLSEEEALPIRFARLLLRGHRVDDATYAEAVSKYGERGVLELTLTVGYYAMSACWMNVMEIEPPADRPQLPV